MFESLCLIVRTPILMVECMYVCMYVRTYVCMYVYIYISPGPRKIHLGVFCQMVEIHVV